ncbi:MAG: type I restriction-modification enzyme R subunit C-terminal domain-containing protein, partial [Candidatus Jacksonbacteria bacterium]
LQNMESRFIQMFSNNAREVVYSLLEKYRLNGIEEIENPHIFELSPFDRMGGIREVEKRFGTMDKLKMAVAGIRNRLYIHA